MGAIIGGTGRHYTGPKDAALTPSAWKGPAGGNPNTTPFEKGCPGCGAGTAEQAERAARNQMADQVDLGRLFTLVVTDITEETSLALETLSARARLSLARALAHYADFGAPSPQELNRGELLAWAREIDRRLAESTETK